MADSITCPRCGRTSHHPKDIEEGYCGACHDWTSAPPGVSIFRTVTAEQDPTRDAAVDAAAHLLREDAARIRDGIDA